MKYLFLSVLLMLSCLTNASDYTFYTKGPISTWVVVDGKPLKNSKGENFNSIEDAVAAATVAKDECPKCDVRIHVEDFILNSARKPASSSSSKAASSVKSSLSASSVAVQERVTLSWEAPIERENGDTFDPTTELQSYLLDLGTGVLIELVPTNLKMNYIADAPKPGQIYRIAAKDTSGLISDFVAFT